MAAVPTQTTVILVEALAAQVLCLYFLLKKSLLATSSQLTSAQVAYLPEAFIRLRQAALTLAARAATGARAPVAATEAAAATVATLHPMDGRPRATEVRAATPARPVIRMSSTVPAMAATEATEGAAWAAIVDPVASFNPVARVDRAVRPVSRRLRTGRLASPAIPANPERCDSREANLMRSHVTTTRAEIGARFHCADARSCVRPSRSPGRW